MDAQVSTDQEHGDSAEPATLVEAFAGFNMTVDHALDLARRCRDGYDGGDYEYDQGDVVVVDFDDLHNLARVALASMALCRRTDNVSLSVVQRMLYGWRPSVTHRQWFRSTPTLGEVREVMHDDEAAFIDQAYAHD